MQKQKNQKQIVYADVAIHDMPEKVSYKAKENREIKNSILVDLFYNDENAEENDIALYNALHEEPLPEGTVIQKMRVENALYLNFQNDISFGVNGKVLVLTEHQSTINRNMPLRSLLYIGRTYEQLVPVRERYRKGMVKLPMPEFYTFYNGTEKLENESELKLSDVYLMQDGNPMLELKVRVININPSAKHEILDKCDVLKEYGLFIDTVRKYQDAGTKEAYRYAIQECIEKGILAGYIRKKGSEVINMLIAEYDYEMDIAVQREEAYEEGEKEGCLEALLEILKYKDNIPEKLEEKLKENGMWDLFKEIEMPLVYTLYDMEKAGIKADGEALKQYGEQLSGRIKELETTIYDLAGETFNINSPKQLGVILFEKLQLPYGKKTKTGYSTAADVLEKLAPEAPIVSHILEYRQLAKLKSTYADGLAGYIAADGRIHSKFHQTITATGRISSTEPNLQNIPIRMELGRMIRKVFIPEDGFVFVDADYSQIELRVLAHISGDERLIEAYREAQDIHRITASQVFHVPFDEVTPLQRRNAKAVNFGIVYGISSFGLSQDLSISRKEAAEYIEKYFETYPGIKQFLDQSVADAKEKGYVTTLFGRRRPVPELSSSNFMQRSFGERVAMNSPIQGTAADIIKIAMIRVNERLKAEHFRSRLILQVHDELLVEAAKEELDMVKQILAEEMHGAANLKVCLEIDMHTGENWYEAK